MKKVRNKRIMNTNDLGALDNVTKDFEIFKSRVANAVLDYMEMQSDSELVECLEKTSVFLNNISFQMTKVFECQEQASKNHNDLFEIGDDLFSNNKSVLAGRRCPPESQTPQFWAGGLKTNNPPPPY